MINKNNGKIDINKLTIDKKTTYKYIINTCSNNSVKFKCDDMQNGWRWIYLFKQKYLNDYVYFNIAFYNGKIKEIYFALDKNEIDNDPWINWSEENEIVRAKYMESWLCKILGNQRSFSWGDVWRGYDKKGGSSTIIVRYK